MVLAVARNYLKGSHKINIFLTEISDGGGRPNFQFFSAKKKCLECSELASAEIFRQQISFFYGPFNHIHHVFILSGFNHEILVFISVLHQ